MAELAARGSAEFRKLLNRDAYLNRASLTRWRCLVEALNGRIEDKLDDLPLPADAQDALNACRSYLANAEELADERNDDYVRRKHEEHASWFATACGSHGLGHEQREAILRDEDNCLVVAGAGTGKTSTVAGKVGYLLRTGAAAPEQILLLSFTKKAAAEMSERLSHTLGAGPARAIHSGTFHSLGLEILGTTDDARPSVSSLAVSERALDLALARYIEELFSDSAARGEIVEFFAYYQFPPRSPFDFVSEQHWREYLDGHDLRTLRGEKVKSYEELTIANWLFINSVEYEYERPYAFPTANARYRQYTPDFYLTQYDIYLEHFGLDRQGRTAPWVDQVTYVQGMAWKRDIHRRYRTRLLETFTYERQEGVLLTSLASKLLKAGVTLRPRAPSAIFDCARQQKLVDPFGKLLKTFLKLFKGNLWSLEDLERNASEKGAAGLTGNHTDRSLAFLRVFRRVLDRYQGELRSSGTIDFDDMIALATQRIESGRFVSPFTHVIVDEFQDLSRGRGRLLLALLAQVADRRLFCVGDDWQSIYRFTGSDIEQMTRFAEVFGFTRRCDLTHSHRFNEELLAASSHFIQENPTQLRKQLVAPRKLGEPAIEIHERAQGETQAAQLDRMLVRIRELNARDGPVHKNPHGTRPRVLVLGRYNFTKPSEWGQIVARHHGLDVEFLTVHRAKGLEGDYAVLLDVSSGRYGFPAEVVDDPLLNLVLAGVGAFPNAEERRLFYVAMTRPRKRCFVLTNPRRRSKFVRELLGIPYKAWVQTAD